MKEVIFFFPKLSTSSLHILAHFNISRVSEFWSSTGAATCFLKMYDLCSLTVVTSCNHYHFFCLKNFLLCLLCCLILSATPTTLLFKLFLQSNYFCDIPNIFFFSSLLCISTYIFLLHYIFIPFIKITKHWGSLSFSSTVLMLHFLLTDHWKIGLVTEFSTTDVLFVVSAFWSDLITSWQLYIPIT